MQRMVVAAGVIKVKGAAVVLLTKPRDFKDCIARTTMLFDASSHSGCFGRLKSFLATMTPSCAVERRREEEPAEHKQAERGRERAFIA